MLEDLFKTKSPHFNVNNTLLVARPGLPFIVGGAALFLFFGLIGLDFPRNLFFAFTLFSFWFFRDPHRETPPEGFGLSPADGQVIRVEKNAACPLTGEPKTKISVFMNVFNVHVNRLPVSGRLISQEYRRGSFLNASFDKASSDNERNALLIEDRSGRRIVVVQIAGLVARRIVSWVRQGDELARGARFGLIKFGSRLDVYLPPEAEVMVALGQKVQAGWSPLFRWPDGALPQTPPPPASAA